MQGLVAGARQAGISLINLDEWIADLEVGVVVISWQPAGSCVGDLVGLWFKALALDKTTKWLGVAEVFSARHRRGNAGAQLLLVVATGDIIYLSGSLEVDILGVDSGRSFGY